MTRKTVKERFNSKWIIQPNSDCWIWTSSLDGSGGYGKFWFKTKKEYAHRVAWLLYHGSIPENKCVLHYCDTPACVNPGHLFLGTQRDNAQDRESKGRMRHVNGEANGKTRITDAEIREIRASNETQSVLARRFGTRQQYISDIQRNKVRLAVICK
jgi:HNH endonuclease